jgi:hypothetical protein
MMPDTCKCLIRCPIHAAAPNMLATVMRVVDIIKSCHERLDASLADVVDHGKIPAITLDDAMDLLRKFEADLDTYGELRVKTVIDFRSILATVDGEPEPPNNAPF